MSDYPVVAGVDPGFANFGVGLVRLLPKGEEIARIEVLRTKSQTKRRHLLAVDDDSRRLAWLGDQFNGMCTEHKVRVIIAEEKRRLPHSGSAAKLAMGWAVAVLVARLLGIPFLQVTPGEIKLATAGSERSAKREVEIAIIERDPASDAIRKFNESMWDKTRNKLKKHREHGFDALGAIVAVLDSELIRAIRPK